MTWTKTGNIRGPADTSAMPITGGTWQGPTMYQASSFTAASIGFQNGSTQPFYIGPRNAGSGDGNYWCVALSQTYSATSDILRVTAAGNAYIYSNGNLSGSFVSTGFSSPSVTDTSDARLKKNIRRDPGRYRGIRKAVELVLYDRIGVRDDEPGVLAQEVQKAGCHADDFVTEGPDGMLCVHYGKLALACALDPEGRL